MTADDAVVIEVAGLRMRYGAAEVLHDVDLRVRRGEVLALLGRMARRESGSGLAQRRDRALRPVR